MNRYGKDCRARHSKKFLSLLIFHQVTSLRVTPVSLSAHPLASRWAVRQFPLSRGIWCTSPPCSSAPGDHLLLLGLIRAASLQLLVKALPQDGDRLWFQSLVLSREREREPHFFPSTMRADFASQGTRLVQGSLSLCLGLSYCLM